MYIFFHIIVDPYIEETHLIIIVKNVLLKHEL